MSLTDTGVVVVVAVVERTTWGEHSGSTYMVYSGQVMKHYGVVLLTP